MKLGSLRTGGRDGTLVVISRDLARAVRATAVAPTLQAALDDWQNARPKLEQLFDDLERGVVDGGFALAVADLAAPLPRAFQFADGSAYVRHVELVRQARGAELPASYWEDPLMYQAVSDGFIAPTDPILVEDEAFGVDFEAELVVVTDDVPMATKTDEAGPHLALFMLVNDVTLRNLVPSELAKQFGFFQSKPASSLSPVAVTPDEFGDAWDGRTLDLELLSTLRGEPFGHPKVSTDQTFSLGRLVEHCARTRKLGAGTLIGTGTISNDGDVGSSCIAEVRAVEAIRDGRPTTQFMAYGDRIRIEMLGRDGRSVFGAIDQVVERYIPNGSGVQS